VVAVKKTAPVPPVTKSGLKEFLLELIIDGDLVSFSVLSALPLAHISFQISLFDSLSALHSCVLFIIFAQSLR
jgi:hypothetical protein